jgi:glycogen debranching enzyme
MLNRRSFLHWSLFWPLSGSLTGSQFLLASQEEKPERSDETLTKGRPTDVESLATAIVMKKDNLFFVARQDGNVPMTGNHGMGLYYHDCRYLNGYELTLAGQAAAPLSASAAQGAVGIFTLTNPPLQFPDKTTLDEEELGVTWHRRLDSERVALLDELKVENFTLKPVQFSMSLIFRSAFEDLFTVRGLVQQQYGQVRQPRWEDEKLILSYEGKDGINRDLIIHATPPADEQRGTTVTFHVNLPPRQHRVFNLSLVIEESTVFKSGVRHRSHQSRVQLQASEHEDHKRWMAEITQVSSNGSALDQLLDRSFRGLRVLRTELGADKYFAAGVPWFVTLFGRDSLVTAWQMMAYHPGIAEQTLRLLAQYQGSRDDDERDEQAGKILHELRIGELANLKVIPQTPFYGTVDATPLFLMLIAQHAVWTGSLELFHDLRPHIELALQWLDRYGDRQATGYVSYDNRTHKHRSQKGIVNKGWKDSGNGIVNDDGTLCEPPIALVEVQGYAYAARLGVANLFERAGEDTKAKRLKQEAERLRERFNRDFWIESKGCYALALQKDGRPASVVSSNPGHALWTGIADDDKAQRTIDRLMAEDMFSGWGVRTLSEKERAYNPIGYHLGTVWPHDNSILAAGFRRYGRDQEAMRLFQGLFDAAFHFHGHLLPEVFCGFGRQEYEIPVSYPVACHPQAWAAGSLPFLLITLLGLEPDAFSKRLRIVRPLLPQGLDRLDIKGLHVNRAAVDLAFERRKTGVHVGVTNLEGELEVQVTQAV